VTRQISQRRDAEKYLFRLADGLHIESVLMHEDPDFPYLKNSKKENRDRRPGRHTLCISSQVGCPVDCKFCATGVMGLLRNLTAGEIVDQVLMVRRLSSTPITNVVVMGMGEPMLNYDALIKACYLFSDDEGLNLAQRRIVISTSGLVPKIERFTKERHKFRLAISLNATTDEVRNRIMPINRKYPIATLLQAAKEYTRQVKQRVTFEYILLADINDTLADAERLKNLVRGIPCKINLIPYNPIHADEHGLNEHGLNGHTRTNANTDLMDEHGLNEHGLNGRTRTNANTDLMDEHGLNGHARTNTNTDLMDEHGLNGHARTNTNTDLMDEHELDGHPRKNTDDIDTSGQARRGMMENSVSASAHTVGAFPRLSMPSVLSFRRPSFERIEAFLACMREGPATVTLRWSKGDDIDAACGQLWTKVERKAGGYTDRTD
jgi:23S rRNA (adenine2503-C2)-methyltransferase